MGSKKKKKKVDAGIGHVSDSQEGSASNYTYTTTKNTSRSPLERTTTATASTPKIGESADVLSLKLMLDSSSSSQSTFQKHQQKLPPCVILCRQDARQLDVLPNENVILLVPSYLHNLYSSGSDEKNGDDAAAPEIVGAAWCKVLSSESKQQQHGASPSPLKSNTPKRSASAIGADIPPGRLKVMPPSLLNVMLGPNLSPQKKANDCVNPLSSPKEARDTSSAVAPSPVAPTPSKGNFSFKIGGGGDQLYTPSPHTSPPLARKKPTSTTPPFSSFHPSSPSPSLASQSAPSPTSSQPRNNHLFWVVPVLSDLGRRIQSKLCHQARVLYLQVLNMPNRNNNNDNDTNLSSSSTTTTMPEITKPSICNNVLLKRVLLAHVMGRWVQPGEEFHHMTFQGKALQVKVIRVESGTCTSTGEEENESRADEEEKEEQGQTDEMDSSLPLLSKSIQALSLDEKSASTATTTRTSASSDSRAIEHQIIEEAMKKSSCAVRLFQVTHSTMIELVTTTTRAEVDSGNSFEIQTSIPTPFSSSSSSPPPPVRKKQQHVAGLDSVLEQLRTFFMAPRTLPEIFPASNNNQNNKNSKLIKAPRGILLHGPSGVGKSSLAKQLVSELLVEKPDVFEDIEYVNCTSLQSQTAVVGQAERQLSRLFAAPSSANPRTLNSRNHTQGSISSGGKKLLVLDDVHLICPKRGSSSTSSTAGANTDRLAATLLSLMDGVDSSEFIYILAITSDPSLLDPALRRPGRIDMEIEVPLPDDAPTRSEILQFQVQQCLQESSGGGVHISQEEWLELAKLAKGFNGADCMLAVKEALRHSIFAARELQAATTATTNTTSNVDRVTSETNSQISSPPHLSLTVNDLKAGIRATKPSAIKSITVEIPQVLWSSIGGMETVKKELREAIELPFLSSSMSEDGESMLDQLGVPPPRGILLYGPPGCSKTLMARALATQGHYNFLAVKGPELLSKWLGESERALASLFRRARMASPAIIFFDEMDAIACKRGSGDSASSNRLLSQLLTELDGIQNSASSSRSMSGEGKRRQPNHHVVVIGATNRPDLLDSALTRPGRIDRKIYVGLPDTGSRAQIFRISLQGRDCSEDIDVEYLAREEVSGGYSGAEIVAICRDAALMALEEADDDLQDAATTAAVRIEQQHVLRAISSMKRQITPEMIAFYHSYRDSSTSRRLKVSTL